MAAAVAHAFGPPEIDTIPPPARRDALVRAVARGGLALPAEVLLAAHRPLLPVMAQALFVAAPLAGGGTAGRLLAGLAAELEQPGAVEALSAVLRAGDAGQAAR